MQSINPLQPRNTRSLCGPKSLRTLQYRAVVGFTTKEKFTQTSWPSGAHVRPCDASLAVDGKWLHQRGKLMNLADKRSSCQSWFAGGASCSKEPNTLKASADASSDSGKDCKETSNADVEGGGEPKLPRERLEVVPLPAARTFSEGFAALTLPWRSVYTRMKMATLNVAFPGAFDYADFKLGTSEAFKLIHPALCTGDRDLVEDLMGEDLLSKVLNRDDGGMSDGNEKTGVATYELHDARLLGLLSARPVALPDGDALLRVQGLFFAEEDAIVWDKASSHEEDPATERERIRYRQNRLHIWTFERPLVDDTEQSEDWYVADMDKSTWPPEDFPPVRND